MFMCIDGHITYFNLALIYCNLLTHLREKVVQISDYNHMFSLAAMELPQINYRAYNGRKYSFVYGVSCGDFLLNASVCFSPADK